MVAKYKINERVILTDSGGGRNLFVDGAITFNDSDGKTLTIKNTKKTLAPDFFTEFFHRFQGAQKVRVRRQWVVTTRSWGPIHTVLQLTADSKR